MAKEETKNVETKEVKQEEKKSVWDKIKAFFANPIVVTIAWILLVLSVVALFIAGTTLEDMNKGITLTIAVVGAIGTLISFICSMIKK